ncbi:hypothetical protein OSB04_002167, partial [Centaurea solstitialis]
MQPIDHLCNYTYLCWRLCNVQATVLQENEKKVSVEETFQSQMKRTEGLVNPQINDQPSSSVEKWVIKFEQIHKHLSYAFMSVLHMYESSGWWRKSEYLIVHFAESWNEMRAGGNAWRFDWFLAQHIAIFYYFMTAFMYTLSPRMAYHFSECVESHAFETYDKFIKAKG